ncbi:MAG TPA: hypothetical protein VH144_02765 [Candidatus Saccharimonadales bacterium]|jgi:hypothetical protein|nr:hypothetical protein [Candidatus Saccharimonadales bacterium]
MIDMPIAAGLVIAIVVLGLGLLFLLSRRPQTGLNHQWYDEQWRGIEGTFRDGKSGQVLAVISADKLLDKAMQQKGFGGQTMGERLKKHPTAFADVNAIWRAHKLRNRIAHDQIQVYEAECRTALNTLRQGLRDLGALL